MSSQQQQQEDKQQWKPDATLEQDKLAPKETDWNLAGLTETTAPATRTRYGGQGRPNMNINNNNVDAASSSDGSFKSNDLSTSDDESLGDDDHERPSPTRIIIEVDQLKRTLEELSLCKMCGGPLEVSLNAKGFGLATKIELSCLDPKCSFVHHGQEPAPTNIHAENNDGYDRLTDYGVNCIYVISFIASGNGTTE